jgi:hypothetical protein
MLLDWLNWYGERQLNCCVGDEGALVETGSPWQWCRVQIRKSAPHLPEHSVGLLESLFGFNKYDGVIYALQCVSLPNFKLKHPHWKICSSEVIWTGTRVLCFRENSVSFLLDEAFLDIESYFSDLLTSKWQTGSYSNPHRRLSISCRAHIYTSSHLARPWGGGGGVRGYLLILYKGALTHLCSFVDFRHAQLFLVHNRNFPIWRKHFWNRNSTNF